MDTLLCAVSRELPWLLTPVIANEIVHCLPLSGGNDPSRVALDLAHVRDCLLPSMGFRHVPQAWNGGCSLVLTQTQQHHKECGPQKHSWLLSQM